ncbi:unnamed protein product [Trichobilharzia szidati]|nr:unnamed protein product [Trichobilharzia szidati]CAH8856725.1 unnamed protein product [Trichobilharzia szidati]
MGTTDVECDNHEHSEVDKRVKLILVGDSNVGKSSLVRAFTTKPTDLDSSSTIGTDLKLHEMWVDGQLVKLYIWDTAGTERFKNTLTPSYFRHAQGALVVYDVGCQKSFDELKTWLKMVEHHSGSRIIKLIVGNKIDLPARAVAVQKAEEYAQSVSCTYLETSAKSRVNVKEAFETLVKMILEKQATEVRIKETRIVLHEKSNARKSRCCHH